jgi:1-acyl-sn-glycerol-3-phosphate acyltransferase
MQATFSFFMRCRLQVRAVLRTRIVLWVRTVLLASYFFIFTIPYAILCLIVFPWLGLPRRYAAVVSWCRITQWMLRLLVGITYHIEGWDHLPDGPAVLLVKHQSYWEALALVANMPRPLCFVLKRELLLIPFFGWVLARLGMVQIDRSQGARAFAQMMAQGRQRLTAGAWMLLFPEGTRTRTGECGHYKTGGARFAVDAGVPVVPIAHNAGQVWPPHAFILYPGVVTVSIGKPIATTGTTAKAVNQQVQDWIETEMRRIDPDAYYNIE